MDVREGGEAKKDDRRGSCLGRVLKVALFVAALGGAALAVWAFVNVPPPAAPVEGDHLSTRDIALARESQHLRAALGDDLWPDFGAAAIPLQLYNDRFGFVVGMRGPEPWEEVAANRIDGHVYYRTAQPERQAFAVLIGGRWAGSLAVKEVADAELPRLFRRKLGPLARLVPYRLFVPSTDQYVSLVLHEQFHAFQAERNRPRFERAEAAYAARSRYPWDETAFQDAWMDEMGLLSSALDARDPTTRLSLVVRFLARRAARREALLADEGTLAFEREVEWLEGLAKYVELASWRRAAEPGYTPLPGIRGDPQFHDYGGWDSQWRTERMNMRIRANLRGDVPFYFSGALQAMLLDDLHPGWKAGFVEGDLFLDDCLE